MRLKNKTVALLLEDLYNEQEFWYPFYRLQEEGAKVVVAGPTAGKTHHGKTGLAATAGAAFGDLRASDLDGVVIPGGYAPDRIRRSPEALALVRDLDAAGKLVAHICHAGWVPISAGIMKGRTTTSYSAIKDDLVNAGALWVDEAVVVDGNMVSSRTPDDLPDFMRAVIEVLAGGR
ncbi:MAG: type 1 glutamine amidotransferase [Deltaproteobacteria bacterium]|nr:type 1 glutamine amidotransferase [Deltaproteobacteria bacterium]